jgi:hypothetical protein
MKPGLLSSWALAFVAFLSPASAQTSAFSYQGRLEDGNRPATGLYDFRFRLMDTPSAGSAVREPVFSNGLNVVTGLFSVTLDFGSSIFDGSPLWLEIALRTNGSLAGFTVLQPAQPLTASPYAVRANSAGSSAVAITLADGGATLTNISGNSILPHSISSNQLTGDADAAYRATDTNAVLALGDARWAASTCLNVKNFGAVGDGLNDDTAALERAWTRFVNVGGTLLFPPGTYRDSGTHITSGWRPGEPAVHDGRLILGQGGVVWAYTGNSTHFIMSNSVPDIEGIEFVNWGAGSNCLYVTGAFSKWSIKNCFFNGWMNASQGALVLDDADSVSLSSLQFYLCSVGVGLGYHCCNLKADLMFRNCGTCVAVGVPTPSYPGGQRDSKVIRLSLLAAYCDTAVAVDVASGPISIEANNWYVANPILLGKIPGISTNYYGYLCSVAIENSWFNSGSTLNPPVQLYSTVTPALQIRDSQFDIVSTPVAIVKSFNSCGDQTRIGWHDSLVSGITKGMFEDSSGTVLTESGADQSRFLNKALGIYNSRGLTSSGGSGYLLDVMDAGPSGRVARLGLNSHSNSFDQFSAGLTVDVDPSNKQAVVEITNADFILTPSRPVAGSASPGVPGSIRWDDNHLYICVRSNVWKRASLLPW